MARTRSSNPTVAILGYGSQGRAIARNLSNSGFPVVLGLRGRSKSRAIAKRDGIKTIGTIKDAIQAGDIVCFAFPDHLHGRVYKRSIAPHLSGSETLWFLHGMSAHFEFVVPPATCDIIMIAPHGPGIAVRENFLKTGDMSAFYAIAQNPSRKARTTINRLARGMGLKPTKLLKTTFEDEAIGDLFGEQAVLCGGLAALISAGFETLVEHGLKPDHAYLEVAYQLDLIVELIKRHGIEGMFARISVAAQYGSAEEGPKIIDKQTKARMSRILNEITSGRFPRRLNRLEPDELRQLKTSLKKLTDPRLEKAARKFAKS